MGDQFGVTLHGYKKPISSFKRDDFKEERLINFVPKQLKPEVKEIICDIGPLLRSC